MNEIAAYDPETYHATLTQSVYVRLEGSTLRLSKPNHNITRRAMHNEPKPDVSYISQKMYDLTDSKVPAPPPPLWSCGARMICILCKGFFVCIKEEYNIVLFVGQALAVVRAEIV